MAKGDDALDNGDEVTTFQTLVQNASADYIKSRFSAAEADTRQYTRFLRERVKYKRLPMYLRLLVETRLQKVRPFPKSLISHGKKKTLIIGLEDVLVSMATEPLLNYDIEVDAKQDNIVFGKIYAKYRPFLFDFLDFTVERFELIVYCSGTESCCSGVLDAIETTRKYFSYRIYNDHVLFENSSYSIKDYDFLFGSDRTKDNTIIVEHSIASFCLKMGNGVLIQRFQPDQDSCNENELAELAKCLEELSGKPSAKRFIKEQIKTSTIYHKVQ